MKACKVNKIVLTENNITFESDVHIYCNEIIYVSKNHCYIYHDDDEEEEINYYSPIKIKKQKEIECAFIEISEKQYLKLYKMGKTFIKKKEKLSNFKSKVFKFFKLDFDKNISS